MFDIFNFNKPGKGVEKRDPNQSRIFIYFELLFRNLWSLCKVNFAYLLLSLPTFIITMVCVGFVTNGFSDYATSIISQAMGYSTMDISNPQISTLLLGIDIVIRLITSIIFLIFFGMGPITAGVTCILRNYGKEKHVWFWSDIWDNIKSNFKQSMLLWALDLFFLIVMTFEFDFYAKIGGLGGVVVYVLFIVTVVYMMMHVYVYQIMITYKITFKNLIKYSVQISMLTAPKTILVLIIMMIVHIGIPFVLFMYQTNFLGIVIFGLLEILILPSATAFTTNFFISNIIERYIKVDET